MAKQSISVTLEPVTIENLKKMAAAEYRNISNMIDYIVAQYVIQQNVSNAEKHGRAALFANSVQITSFGDTQKALKKEVHIDEADRAFLDEN